MTNLNKENWKVTEEYGVPVALLDIDVMRPNRDGSLLRWTYMLTVEVTPSTKGVDHQGNRMAGSARPAIISIRPEPTVEYTLVRIGSIITTPYGNYRVEWYSPTNKDHLKFIPV